MCGEIHPYGEVGQCGDSGHYEKWLASLKIMVKAKWGILMKKVI